MNIDKDFHVLLFVDLGDIFDLEIKGECSFVITSVTVGYGDYAFSEGRSLASRVKCPRMHTRGTTGNCMTRNHSTTSSQKGRTKGVSVGDREGSRVI